MSRMLGVYLRSLSMRVWLFALLLCAVTVFAYRPAWHGGFVWDDDRYVTNNPLLTAPDGLRRIWFSLDAPSQYFPLSYTVLMIGRSLWGLNPEGYHWLNLSLHIANALLVWALLSRLKVPGAWLASAIFALHPVQVESVAWISELKNVLMGFFFLLTLLVWTEFLHAQTARRWILYAAALFFYFLALSAKTTACTLPAALLLIIWLKEQPLTRGMILQIVPFGALASGMGLLAIWWEKYHQGTRVLMTLPPLERLLIATRAIWFYLSKIFWPSNLTFIYPRWNIDPKDLTAYSWLVGCGAACAALWFARRRFGRGIEVAALFFVSTLGPLLGFIMLYTFRYTFVADHYQYLASIGLIALVAAALVRLSQSIRHGRSLLIAASSVILGCLGLLTWRQSEMFRDAETLWRITLARNPGCWMAYNNLGILELTKGDINEAIRSYERSVSLYRDQPEAHYNLGSALLQQGRLEEAIAQCKIALRLNPNDPDAHVVLGNALLTKNDVEEAISEYTKALSLYPDDVQARHNLGIALQQRGQQ
jgi:protein O-mannosyl-transferase